MGAIVLFFLMVISTVAYSDYIPERAHTYMPTVIKEQESLIPDHPFPPYFLSLIEHESCVSLKSKRCWSPTSELKTKREHGVGLGQLTRAWRKDGSLRFDRVSELAKTYPELLNELRWDNIKQRPDLQIRGLLLVYKESYDRLPKTILSNVERLAFSDMAYNGGYGRVIKDRRRCGLSSKCDPSLYFNNVERYCTASKRILYGNRSACDINRNHVRDILTKRIEKYAKWYIQFKTRN